MGRKVEERGGKVGTWSDAKHDGIAGVEVEGTVGGKLAVGDGPVEETLLGERPQSGAREVVCDDEVELSRRRRKGSQRRHGGGGEGWVGAVVAGRQHGPHRRHHEVVVDVVDVALHPCVQIEVRGGDSCRAAVEIFLGERVNPSLHTGNEGAVEALGYSVRNCLGTDKADQIFALNVNIDVSLKKL